MNIKLISTYICDINVDTYPYVITTDSGDKFITYSIIISSRDKRLHAKIKSVEKNKEGYIIQKHNTMTSLEGIFITNNYMESNDNHNDIHYEEGRKVAFDVENWLEMKGFDINNDI